MSTNYARRDKQLKQSANLKNGAGSTQTGGIQVRTANGTVFLADCEVEISSPALTTSQLPDAKTVVYDIEHADKSDFSDAAVLYDNALTVAGSAGAGAAAATKHVKLPHDVKKYIRCKATQDDATADASAASYSMSLVF